MTYEKLIETISAIIQEPNVYKNGLTLTYTLTSQEHMTLNEELYRQTNQYAKTFIPNDEFDVEIDGILVKFVKLK
jgi:hypothetical protein